MLRTYLIPCNRGHCIETQRVRLRRQWYSSPLLKQEVWRKTARAKDMSVPPADRGQQCCRSRWGMHVNLEINVPTPCQIRHKSRPSVLLLDHLIPVRSTGLIYHFTAATTRPDLLSMHHLQTTEKRGYSAYVPGPHIPYPSPNPKTQSQPT